MQQPLSEEIYVITHSYSIFVYLGAIAIIASSFVWNKKKSVRIIAASSLSLLSVWIYSDTKEGIKDLEHLHGQATSNLIIQLSALALATISYYLITYFRAKHKHKV